ncbi:DUF3037 domain-containing protein [Actinophytocola gossypii]|uniref:DUF3037 domain-containing protein n=1 Tax=Actinophytocola gossypii TaxID=2812003 RepID=A0ABT2J703_9PSEU|nr:DUF3037 domain-containing protein [Actinophytocola gossypii]MCT2583578.1 DUF3037 domain-containing protein [Actinophytocola gossypii]
MPHVFEYALVRAVPRQERGEFMNVGVIVYCAPLRYLRCRTHVDAARLRALDPDLDLDALADALRSWCEAGAGVGPTADSTPGQRFRWLTAPRSTILQTSPAHTGLTDDPEAELNRLLGTHVRTGSG